MNSTKKGDGIRILRRKEWFDNKEKITERIQSKGE